MTLGDFLHQSDVPSAPASTTAPQLGSLPEGGGSCDTRPWATAACAAELEALDDCGKDPCERYAEATEEKKEVCLVSQVGGSAAGCSDERAVVLECLTPCVTNAPCEAFDGSDYEAVQQYSYCVTACG